MFRSMATEVGSLSPAGEANDNMDTPNLHRTLPNIPQNPDSGESPLKRQKGPQSGGSNASSVAEAPEM